MDLATRMELVQRALRVVGRALRMAPLAAWKRGEIGRAQNDLDLRLRVLRVGAGYGRREQRVTVGLLSPARGEREQEQPGKDGAHGSKACAISLSRHV